MPLPQFLEITERTDFQIVTTSPFFSVELEVFELKDVRALQSIQLFHDQRFAGNIHNSLEIALLDSNFLAV